MKKTTDIEDARDPASTTHRLQDRSFSGIKEILLPIEFTEENRQAIDDAVNLAQLWGAQLTLLHVYQKPYNLCYLRGPHICDAIEAHRKCTEEILRLLTEGVNERYANCRAELRQGNYGDEIVKAANELQTDLLIISIHGNKWWRRIAYGSETEAIVRRAPCPVLVLPAHGSEMAGLN